MWDGEDYVPELLDGWFADSEGELSVATLDDDVIAFAHRTWLCPGIAWFEGIRTDPAYQGRGAGKAITEHFIRAARADGATHIDLSTYIDNEASIHILETSGFQRVATFSYLERPSELAPPDKLGDSSRIRPISGQETMAFMKDSEFLSLARRRLPRGWRFFPFDLDPNEAIARLECRLGFDEGDGVKAALCIRQNSDTDGGIIINFLDGEALAMSTLLNHALCLYEGKTMETMVPIHLGRHAASLDVFREAGFKSWSDFKPDVFAYEMVL
jgi:L-amino acid N-acyltransferase YncA